jgi:hypothetical protein
MKINMKKITIKVALIAVSFFTIQLNATAQKVKKGSVKMVSATPTNSGISVLETVAGNISYTPTQDPNLGRAIGFINIQADSLIEIDQNQVLGKYYIQLAKVKENKTTQEPGGLAPLRYIFNNGYLSEADFPAGTASNIKLKIVLKKFNDKGYQYDIYNLPLNQKFVIQLVKKVDVYTSNVVDNLCGYSLVNGFCVNGLQGKEMTPNYVAVNKNGQIILQDIDIKNPVRVN